MSVMREIAVDFTCDQCSKSRAAARFTVRPSDPEREVPLPSDWFELRRGSEGPMHFCSIRCVALWGEEAAE